MKEIKFSRNELRIIKSALVMTGGMELDEWVNLDGDKPLTEEQCYDVYKSALSKINERLKMGGIK